MPSEGAGEGRRVRLRCVKEGPVRAEEPSARLRERPAQCLHEPVVGLELGAQLRHLIHTLSTQREVAAAPGQRAAAEAASFHRITSRSISFYFQYARRESGYTAADRLITEYAHPLRRICLKRAGGRSSNPRFEQSAVLSFAKPARVGNADRSFPENRRIRPLQFWQPTVVDGTGGSVWVQAQSAS